MDKKNEAVELKVLRLIADGARTPAALKTKMRKDVRKVVQLLRNTDSIRTEGDQLILTRKGAGRLRFAS